MKHGLATVWIGLALGCGGQPSGATDDGAPVDGAPGDGSSLVVASSTIGQLAADDHALFYVEGTSVKAFPLEGGTPRTLYTDTPPAQALTQIDRLVVGSSEVLVVVGHLDPTTLASDQTLVLVPKLGGPPRVLATSNDVRAFLGATFDGEYVYFSSFDSLYRVPRAGGPTTFVGESNGSTHYWIFSPVVTADQVYWAEDTSVFRMARTESTRRGAPLAVLPAAESGKIVASGSKFVVALSPELDFQSPPDAFVEIDPATGAVGTRIPLADANILQVVATERDVWTVSLTGLVRVPRVGGPPVQVLTDPCSSAVTTGGSLYVTTEAGITRLPLP